MTQSVISTSSQHIDVVGGIWKKSASPASFTVTCHFAPKEEEEEEEEDGLPYDFRALTAEEAADPIAVYVLNTAPSTGLQMSDIPEYHLTGTNTMGIAVDEWTGNTIYLVTSDLSGNNGEKAELQTMMGLGMNADYTINGVYLVGWNVIYLN